MGRIEFKLRIFLIKMKLLILNMKLRKYKKEKLTHHKREERKG